jgi:ankyrin repeat protein
LFFSIFLILIINNSSFLATGGHANIVSRLIEHGANIEAQSERTKDTALSLACSGGRQDVVEVLLKNGANREHRNVSDYTGMFDIYNTIRINIGCFFVS